MSITRAFTTLASLPVRGVSARTIRPGSSVIRYQQRQTRGIAKDHSNLGGVEGSEPPGPQPNPHNWIAGTITVTAVLFIAWRMRVAKLRQKEEGKA
ncbi:hypothetical protein QBC47DRAFT_392807 [Echria macrotheca]|uniref:Uncharacterized protein n=1 Tax=Echria macrotheca TaxID=438768 RepID=A0AAJ0B390_9PEZI|nr:hypothetical protein QBC47DRAFT_392807 [Echria macrotheca]